MESVAECRTLRHSVRRHHKAIINIDQSDLVGAIPGLAEPFQERTRRKRAYCLLMSRRGGGKAFKKGSGGGAGQSTTTRAALCRFWPNCTKVGRVAFSYVFCERHGSVSLV